MLTTLAKLASISKALKKSSMEKQAVLGVLATIGGKAAATAANHPLKTLTALTAVQGSRGKYRENMSKFRDSSGQNVPTPPGVER